MWKPSLPQFFTRYLLQQILAGKGLRGELLELIRNEMDREGELIDTGLLPAQVKDPDLWVGNTTVEPTLGVGLVLAVAVALGRPPTHLGLLLSCRSESSNKSLVV